MTGCYRVVWFGRSNQRHEQTIRGRDPIWRSEKIARRLKARGFRGVRITLELEGD